MESVACAILMQTGLNCGAEQLPPAKESSLWKGEVGEGFQTGAQTLTMESGIHYGLASFGSREAHHMAITSISYGRMLGSVKGEDHWYRGNWECRLELFGGPQYSPDNNWLAGLTPHLRYNFATGTRWIPFLDGGTGVAATGIGHPDLGSAFEFNTQAGGGTHWFIRDNIALTAGVHFVHISNAGISQPNHGMNGVMMMLGITTGF